MAADDETNPGFKPPPIWNCPCHFLGYSTLEAYRAHLKMVLETVQKALEVAK